MGARIASRKQVQPYFLNRTNESLLLFSLCMQYRLKTKTNHLGRCRRQHIYLSTLLSSRRHQSINSIDGSKTNQSANRPKMKRSMKQPTDELTIFGKDAYRGPS